MLLRHALVGGNIPAHLASTFFWTPPKMLINRDHRVWAVITVLATAVFTILFLLRYYPETLPFRYEFPVWLSLEPGPGRKVGATPVGLAYGILAFAIFLFAGALGYRKKFPLLRVGSAKFWLKGHIWLTILTIPLVVMHANMKLGAPMTLWLVVLYAAVMISGFYGLALQQFLPRLMKEQLPLETVFEQIPYLRGRLTESAVELHESLLKDRAKLRDEAEKAITAAKEARQKAAEEKAKTEVAENVAVATEEPPLPVLDEKADESFTALIDALEKEVLPYLMVKKTKHLPMHQQSYSDQIFRVLRLATIADHRDWVNRMESWCDERRSMDRQTKFQHWLHGWLLFHVPLSFLLIGYTGWHAVVALFNY